MIESGFWNTIKRNIGGTPGLHIQRVENGLSNPGTPDVELCLRGRTAWVELKLIKSFPARPSTPVKIKHFTEEQKTWLRLRGMSGGKAWLFVQVQGVGYFLFDWKTAQLVGEMTQVDWWRSATWWKGSCDWTSFLKKIIS